KQHKLDQDIIDLIKQKLTTVNLFIQDLYQLYNTNYSQARLVIQQLTANNKI
ncbi:5118_t:CDS:1, partial [Scutellospora calospora]